MSAVLKVSQRAGALCALSLIMLGCVALDGRGADADPVALSVAQGQLEKLVEGEAKALQNISSLQYSATSTYNAEPQFMKEAGDGGSTTCKYSFAQRGKDWLVDVDVVGKSGLYTSEKWAYNGENTQSFQKKGGQLTITKDTLKTSSILANKTYIFDPIIFLPREKIDQPDFPLTLSNFSSPANWKSLIARAASIELSGAVGQRVLSFEIPGGVDVHTKRAFNYKVVCEEDKGWYPVEWQTFDLKGHLLTKYEVVRMGEARLENGLNFLYPIAAEKRRYVDDGRLAGVAKISIDSLKVGENIPDDFFTIDPSQATTIRDLDAATVINVPQ